MNRDVRCGDVLASRSKGFVVRKVRMGCAGVHQRNPFVMSLEPAGAGCGFENIVGNKEGFLRDE